MKRLSIAILGLLLAAGCSSNSASPSTTTSGPSTTRFSADLKAANETPAISNAESTATGSATIDITITKDASGNATAATTNFQVNMANLQPTSVVNIAHIHTGASGVAGPILVNTTTVPGEVAVAGGAANFTRVGISLPVATAQSIIDNPAGFYFNVHTTLNPGGVMRGQLVKQ